MTGRDNEQALPLVTAGKHALLDVTLTVSPADYSPYITVDKSDLTAPKLVYTDEEAVREIIEKTGTLTFTLRDFIGETKEYTTQFTV